MKPFTIAAAVAVTITAAAAFTTPAHADEVDLPTAICATLDDRPVPSTVGALGLALMAEGASSDTAAKAVVAAVFEQCPRHIRLIKAYARSGQDIV